MAKQKRNRRSLLFIAALFSIVVIVSAILLERTQKTDTGTRPVSYDIPPQITNDLEQKLSGTTYSIDHVKIEADFLEKTLDQAKSGGNSTGENSDAGVCAWPSAALTSKSGNSPSVVVDKSHCLSSSYIPTDLVDVGTTGVRKTKSNMLVRQVIVTDMKAMISSIKAASIDISVLSCYRSYATQKRVYNNWVASLGQSAADKVSARPGHSEHQLGTTCDFGTNESGDTLGTSFANTKAGKWLATNGPSYGFKMSYPAGQESTTGYSYEPWHWRWVGR